MTITWSMLILMMSWIDHPMAPTMDGNEQLSSLLSRRGSGSGRICPAVPVFGASVACYRYPLYVFFYVFDDAGNQCNLYYLIYFQMSALCQNWQLAQCPGHRIVYVTGPSRNG